MGLQGVLQFRREHLRSCWKHLVPDNALVFSGRIPEIFLLFQSDHHLVTVGGQGQLLRFENNSYRTESNLPEDDVHSSFKASKIKKFQEFQVAQNLSVLYKTSALRLAVCMTPEGPSVTVFLSTSECLRCGQGLCLGVGGGWRKTNQPSSLATGEGFVSHASKVD